jgi:hypothetical protein
MSKNYESPEAVELGAAEDLTLGGTGCATDFRSCERTDDNQVPTADAPQN